MANPYMGLAGSLARARRPPAQNDVYMQQPRGTGRPPQQYGSGSSGMFDPNKLRGPNASGFYSNDSIVRGGPQRGGGLGGVAGIDLLGAPGALQNTMQPPQGGGFMGGMGGLMDQARGAIGGMAGGLPSGGVPGRGQGQGFFGGHDTSGGFFGGNPGTQYMGSLGGLMGGLGGMSHPGFGGGPSPGVHMMPPAPGMQVPGFGGGPTMGGNMDPNTSRLARPNVPAFGGGPQPGPQPMMLPPNPYGGPKP